MRAGFLFVLAMAPAARAGGLGLELDFAAGPTWSLKDRCNVADCPLPIETSVRAGYGFAPFASVGVRAEAVLGPEGRDFCPGNNCAGTAGYRAASLLVDARLHTLGQTQAVLAAAFGVGRLIRLQCNCSEVYDIHGSGLPVLELAVGARRILLPSPVYAGIEGRFSAMFGAESADLNVLGNAPPVRRTGVIITAIGASFVLGVSL